MKTNDSSHYSPFELESRGWKINRINSIEKLFNHFTIFHPFYFPFGRDIISTRPGVIEFIENFINEEQHKEEIERFNLDR